MLRPGRDKPNPYFFYKAREESGAALRGDPRFQNYAEEERNCESHPTNRIGLDVMGVKTHGSLKSPACSCVSITLPPSS